MLETNKTNEQISHSMRVSVALRIIQIGWAQWFKSIIQATQEVEIRRIIIQAKSSQTPSQPMAGHSWRIPIQANLDSI
jgi:hypothetical protein